MTRRSGWIVVAALLAVVAAAGLYALLRPEPCEVGADGRIDCPMGVLYAHAQDAADWSVNIAALLPGIDRCMSSYAENFSRETVAITAAWPATDGFTFLRMRDSLGHGMDCLWRPAENQAMFFTVGSGDFQKIFNEGDPSFIPASVGGPHGACGEAREIKDAAGKLVGWVANTRCNFAY